MAKHSIRNILASSIDELPLIILAASQADGKTSLRNAEELRFKESDRILSMAKMMERFNISIDEFNDGMDIHGGIIEGNKINTNSSNADLVLEPAGTGAIVLPAITKHYVFILE